MARSIAQIQAAIVAARQADPVIGDAGTNPLSSTSNVAVWLLWTWIVATCQYITESLFDSHKAEVAGIIATQKPHTLEWYATMAKAFQYGATLPAGSDVYNPVAPAGDASLVVSYAAAVEVLPYLRIKAATLTGGVLGPLTSDELTALTVYMGRIKDAGVPLNITSGNADSLRVGVTVYYDPLILDATGARLDGTAATPLQDAVNGFLDTLPFNGVFVLNSMVAAMQAVEGVTIADVSYCAAQYGALPYSAIAAYYVPDAGYLTLDAGYFTANASYVAY